MRFTLDDILDELCEEYPQVTRGSITKICKTGLSSIKKYLTHYYNVELKLSSKEIVIFFKPQKAENYNKLVGLRAKKKRENEGSNS